MRHHLAGGGGYFWGSGVVEASESSPPPAVRVERPLLRVAPSASFALAATIAIALSQLPPRGANPPA